MDNVEYVKDGPWIRRIDDNYAVKTKIGQIFQGFKTEADAKKWAEKHGWRFEIIPSPWNLDVR